MNNLQLLSEAKHSIATLMGFTGYDSHANVLLLKWPDILESVLKGDEKQALADFSCIICQPLAVLAESLIQAAATSDISAALLDDVRRTLAEGIVDPIEAKRNLIRICNAQLYKLKETGYPVKYIKPLGGEE